MHSWLFDLPAFQLFSLLSVIVTGSLLALSMLRPNRRGGWAFRLLAASLTLWQLAEFIKNSALPRMDLDQVEFWTRVSFCSVTQVYPTVFWMALRMTGRPLRRWGGLLGLAYASSAFLVAADALGWVLGAVSSRRFGVVHEAMPMYWLFVGCFVFFCGLALYLLYKGVPDHRVDHRRVRLVFWAAAAGLALGSLDVVSILWNPLFPLANLSAALYAVVLYWAIYRFNYWGGRGWVREAAFRGICWLAGSLLIYGWTLGVRFAQDKAGGVAGASLLLGAVFALLGPLAWNRLQVAYRLLFPAAQNGPALLLAVSRGTGHATQATELLAQVLDTAQEHFHLSGAYALICSQVGDNRHWEAIGGDMPGHCLALLERDFVHPLSRRDLRDKLYYSERLSRAELRVIQRDWKLLRRLNCDIVVPVAGRKGLEALLCLREGRVLRDTWQSISQLLVGMGQIVGDQLLLLRLGQERERERHLGELGLMAAGLAHEIKNPLEGVYGAAQILQEEGKGNARFVGMVLRESLRLNDVVQGFLRYARPYAAVAELQDLMPLLAEWKETCRVDAPAIEVRVRVDASALHQIVLNLVSNAQRVQPSQVPLRLVVRKLDGWVECACVDQGGGVPSERLERLFEPFQSGSVGGNGLGLALSRKMARAMGGDLLYRPIQGGAEFCIRLLAG